ncbi:MAG TPA: SRPBCC family protein [Nitrospiria bacterium]|jgi:carbon monoxide dehydrogenase subunit G|nr:SRPBCC family protein [Nitrospiria bacterium]
MTARSPAQKELAAWIGIILAVCLILFFLAGLWWLPGEYQVRTQVAVSRTPEQAWAWFADPDHWGRRFPMVQADENASNAMTGAGDRRRVTLHIPGGSTLVSEILITDFVKGHLYADRHLGDWMDGKPLPIANARDRLEFDPEGSGKTRITFKGVFEVKGPLNRWLAFLVLKPTADRIIAQALEEYGRSIGIDRPSPTTRG